MSRLGHMQWLDKLRDVEAQTTQSRSKSPNADFRRCFLAVAVIEATALLLAYRHRDDAADGLDILHAAKSINRISSLALLALHGLYMIDWYARVHEYPSMPSFARITPGTADAAPESKTDNTPRGSSPIARGTTCPLTPLLAAVMGVCGLVVFNAFFGTNWLYFFVYQAEACFWAAYWVESWTGLIGATLDALGC